jgi:hypothetical protein
MKSTTLASVFCFLLLFASAQKEGYVWYFGNKAGLNFNTTPPTVLTNGSLTTSEGCASIADGAGSLLFYTDGITVYNSLHQIMANGTGLMGNGSTTQSGIIVKQPGNTNIYYIFTEDDVAGPDGLRYSIVDMNLAAGLGSVTVKNDSLHTPSCEKITAVKHCNGVDAWVLSHDYGNADFRAYLLTATGLNTVAVISTAGTPVSGNQVLTLGQMKVSPDGKKIGCVVYQAGFVEVYDFDPSTGMVSNALTLLSTGSYYGCEFSPDGSKFYGARYSPPALYQWDLCAGTATAVLASMTTLSLSGSLIGSMQLAPDGMIYVARSSSSLSGIMNPNVAGAACNFTPSLISVAPNTAILGLPNIINSYFKPLPQPFTHTVSCMTGTFTAPPVITSTISGCTQISNSVTGYVWNFGDPGSGSANTSTLANPTHTFSTPGNYTTSIAIQYQCGSDTIKLPVTITEAAPTISVNGVFTVCPGEKRVYTASGAGSYTWSVNNLKTNTLLATIPATTVTYSVSGTGTNSCIGSKTFTVNVKKCTGIESFAAAGLQVFPNPFGDLMHVHSALRCTLKLVDCVGAVRATAELDAGEHELDLHDIDPGVYSIMVETADGIFHQRVVKE